MKKVNITLKIYKNNKMVVRVATHKKNRIYWRLQAEKFKDCLFQVRVGYSNNYWNESIKYKTKKDLIHALRAFTEPDLVREFI